MPSLEEKLDGIRSCVNSIEGTDCTTTIYFTMDDVEDICYWTVKNESCGYCCYGDTRFFILRLTENHSEANRYVSVVNFCGCLTYDPSYHIRDFPTYDLALESFQE